MLRLLFVGCNSNHEAQFWLFVAPCNVCGIVDWSWSAVGQGEDTELCSAGACRAADWKVAFVPT